MTHLSEVAKLDLGKLEHRATVVWFNAEKLAVFCPICATVQECAIHPEPVGWQVPAIVTADCCRAKVQMEVKFPAGGLVYNPETRRVEAAGPKSFVLADAKSAYDQALVDKEMMVEQGIRSMSTGDVVDNPNYSTDFGQALIVSALASLLSTRPSGSIEIVAPLAPKNGEKGARSLAMIKSSNSLVGKTVAILYRGLDSPPVIAVSGWGSGLTGCAHALDQKVWYEEVKKLQVRIGHKVSSDRFPNKYPNGEEKSCHAEKLAMTFYIKNRCEASGRKLMPSKVHIALDRNACMDCQKFRRRIQKKYKVKINFVLMRNEKLEKKAAQVTEKVSKRQAQKTKMRSRQNALNGSRGEKEYTYCQSEMSYHDDCDDERESGDAEDTNSDEPPRRRPKYLINSEVEGTPTPSRPNAKSQAMMKHRLSKAEKKYPLEKHAPRKRPARLMSSDSDTDYGIEPITPLAAIRESRTLFQDQLQNAAPKRKSAQDAAQPSIETVPEPFREDLPSHRQGTQASPFMLWSRSPSPDQARMRAEQAARKAAQRWVPTRNQVQKHTIAKKRAPAFPPPPPVTPPRKRGNKKQKRNYADKNIKIEQPVLPRVSHPSLDHQLPALPFKSFGGLSAFMNGLCPGPSLPPRCPVIEPQLPIQLPLQPDQPGEPDQQQSLQFQTEDPKELGTLTVQITSQRPIQAMTRPVQRNSEGLITVGTVLIDLTTDSDNEAVEAVREVGPTTNYFGPLDISSGICAGVGCRGHCLARCRSGGLPGVNVEVEEL